MGLVVVERFSMLREAQVARAVLHSAGIPAAVSDEYYGSLDWVLATALQGFRLSVPVEDFTDAAQVLAAAREAGVATPFDLARPPRGWAWIAWSLVVGLTTLESAGFLVEAARLRPTPARFVALGLLTLPFLYVVATLLSRGPAVLADPAAWFAGLVIAALAWWMVRGAQPRTRGDDS